jgi:hypothetical protein
MGRVMCHNWPHDRHQPLNHSTTNQEITEMSITKTPKYWQGSITTCNMCGGLFNGRMFDARLGNQGWGNICKDCFRDYNCSLGTGSGQEYSQQPDGRWLKVGG